MRCPPWRFQGPPYLWPPLVGPCYCAICCIRLASLESYREHCLGRKHRRQVHGVVVSKPAPAN
eukprot:1527474-Lingulodinium_polyedra.AAC.1